MALQREAELFSKRSILTNKGKETDIVWIKKQNENPRQES